MRIIMWIVALVMAIPTYGVSLVVSYLMMYWFDKFVARRILINAIVTSYRMGGDDQILDKISMLSYPMVFTIYGGKVVTDLGSVVSGFIPHPVTGEVIVATITKMADGRTLVKGTSV